MRDSLETIGITFALGLPLAIILWPLLSPALIALAGFTLVVFMLGAVALPAVAFAHGVATALTAREHGAGHVR